MLININIKRRKKYINHRTLFEYESSINKIEINTFNPIFTSILILRCKIRIPYNKS